MTAPSDRTAYPKALIDAESALIAKRREHTKIDPNRPLIGLALSGGGIRSATFNLGLLQALAQRQFLRRIDFLSTVSGGSFIGGFVGALISRGNSKHSLEGKEGVALAEEVLSRPSRILRWLRENGRYLAPNGSGDLLAAGADALRSWLTVQVLLVLALLTLFATMLWAEPWITTQTATLANYLPIPAEVKEWKFAPLVFAAGYLIPVLILAYWLISDWKNWWVDLAQWLLMIGVMAWAILAGLPLWLPGIIAVAMITAIVASLDRKNQFAGRFSRDLGFRQTTALLSRVLVILIAGSLLTVLFWCGSKVAEAPFDTFRQVAVALGGLVGVGLASGRVFAKLLPHIPARRLRDAGALIIALVWLGVIVVGCSAAVHALFSESRGFAAGMLAVVTFVIGLNRQILNRATLNPIYRARLGRAYVGASNNHRVPCSPTEPPRPITDPLEDDDVPWPSYAPHARGGPLHLICMTVNETKSGRSSLEEHDRKGLSFCVGPAALSVSATYHALWGEKPDGDRVPIFKRRPFSQRIGEFVPDALKSHETSPIHRAREHSGYHALFTEENEEHDVECLTLGGWMAVSGAAVSTGVGAQTSLATSLLCTLANLRLGYWWDSHVPHNLRKNTRDSWFWRRLNVVFPVFSYLGQEMLARFYGPNRRLWYLTDGGHFENCGAFELLRRRLPIVVLSDCGQDPQYKFTDLSNLTLKARIDLTAEIRTFTRAELDWFLASRPNLRHLSDTFGTREQFAQPSVEGVRPHALLAWVFYDGAHISNPEKEEALQKAGSIMVIVKPSLSGDEPMDLLHFSRQYKDFPQQSTGDQFFDEAQWESYRKLGEHVGLRLFATELDDYGLTSRGDSPAPNQSDSPHSAIREGER